MNLKRLPSADCLLNEDAHSTKCSGKINQSDYKKINRRSVHLVLRLFMAYIIAHLLFDSLLTKNLRVNVLIGKSDAI